jgi:tetraacyldisaccharide 4'-kinase
MKMVFPDKDIFVGKDRTHSIREAVRKKNKIILLDDGFQSTHIQRDMRIMLINQAHPYYFLRNFKFMLKLEDYVFFLEPGKDLEFYTKRFPGVRFGTYRFIPGGYYLPSGQNIPVKGKTLLGFSALGDNRRFRKDLESFDLVDFVSFPDHHKFSQADIQRLENLRLKHSADFLVCTLKDFIKIKDMDIKKIPLIYSQNSIQLSFNIINHLLDRLDNAGKENNTETPV